MHLVETQIALGTMIGWKEKKMTVAQLIKKLQRMPQDAIVTMSNNDNWVNGEYEVKSVETYDCSTVEICTDYRRRFADDIPF